MRYKMPGALTFVDISIVHTIQLERHALNYSGASRRTRK